VTKNTFLILGIWVVFIYICLPATWELWRELKFYKANNWDMKLDDGSEVWNQEKFQRMYFFLPIGALKIVVHINRIILLLIISYGFTRIFINVYLRS
jgi:hypothetical protein